MTKATHTGKSAKKCIKTLLTQLKTISEITAARSVEADVLLHEWNLMVVEWDTILLPIHK